MVVTTSIQHSSFVYVMIVGVLQALSGGTILYVCVFEILDREKCKKHVSGLLQFLSAISGFCALMMVELLVPHDHNDDHDMATFSSVLTTTTSTLLPEEDNGSY